MISLNKKNGVQNFAAHNHLETSYFCVGLGWVGFYTCNYNPVHMLVQMFDSDMIGWMKTRPSLMLAYRQLRASIRAPACYKCTVDFYTTLNIKLSACS